MSGNHGHKDSPLPELGSNRVGGNTGPFGSALSRKSGGDIAPGAEAEPGAAAPAAPPSSGTDGDPAALQAVLGHWAEAEEPHSHPADGGVQSAAEHGIQGSGSELPERAELERAFGTSFADVRIHVDPKATRAIQAEAYTLGDQIVFAQSNPSRELLAHELTHVVQQRAGKGPASGVGQAGDCHEEEADAAASKVAAGGNAELAHPRLRPSGASAVQRRAVQRYESGEHALCGGGTRYPFQGGAEVALPNGARAYLAEMAAMGDFYASMDQIAQSPRQETEALIGFVRLEALWYHARRMAKPPAPAAQGIKAKAGKAAPPPPNQKNLDVFKSTDAMGQEDDVWDKKPTGQPEKLSAYRQKIYRQFAPSWDFFGISFSENEPPPGNLLALKATLGRRRFRGLNDTLFDPDHPSPARGNSKDKITADPAHMGGDFQDQASHNVAHFAPNSWETWKEFHKRACEKHKQAKTPQERDLALAEDMLGSHFLTDRFSSGHTVNKEELMTHATGMMLGLAGKDPKKREGSSTHHALAGVLDKGLETCFEDAKVGQKWDEGVDRAFRNGLISQNEAATLKSLPKAKGWNSLAVCGQIRDVLMGMPWRDVGGQLVVGADSRNYGPDSTANGKGDYQLGVGNLAALRVHDALNAIGFRAKNAAGKSWRMQGDDHLTSETLDIAHRAVTASQAQVRAGLDNPDAIMQFMPTEGTIDPQWVREYFQGGKAQFDAGQVQQLCEFVTKTKIPLGVKAFAGRPGQDAVSPEMTEICHRMMEILFLAPKTPQAQKEDNHHSGLNISMLKEFLIERLPEMVSMSYIATSAADLPKEALESYAPRGQANKLLPRAANDFRWEGSRLLFQLNITGCKAGEYRLGIEVRDKDLGYDFTETGIADPGLAGSDTDPVLSTEVATVHVPALKPEPSADNGDRYVTAFVDLPAQGKVGRAYSFAMGDDRYVIVYADPSRTMCIGRSTANNDSRKSANAHPVGNAPIVTDKLKSAAQKGKPAAKPGPNAHYAD